jgi:hypothetical protein
LQGAIDDGLSNCFPDDNVKQYSSAAGDTYSPNQLFTYSPAVGNTVDPIVFVIRRIHADQAPCAFFKNNNYTIKGNGALYSNPKVVRFLLPVLPQSLCAARPFMFVRRDDAKGFLWPF